MLEKLGENAEAEQHVILGRVEIYMYNSFDVNSPWGENFTSVKTSGVSSQRDNFFVSFSVANTVRGLMTHRVDFTPRRILVVNRPSDHKLSVFPADIERRVQINLC